MKSYKILYCFIFLLLPIIGCDDEAFLSEEPKSFNTVDNIFTSSAQVDQLLITLYRDYRNFRLVNWQYKGHSTDVFDSPEFRISQSFSDYSRINAQSGEFNSYYSFYYQLISRANNAIEVANREGITWNNETDRLYAIAQARFFRAFAYGCLAELFGGVPLVTEVITEPKFDFVRTSRIETYQFAIDELVAILDDLPETTSQDGRVVKGAAQHYLSEFYLGLGVESADASNYDQAIKYASDLIDGGVFSLMTERFGARMDEEGKDVWWDLFRKDNVNYSDGNKECIWSFQTDFDAYLAEDGNAVLNYPRNFMPVYRAIPGVTGVAEDVGGRGVAFIAPTPYVTDLIWDETISGNDQRNAEHNIRRTILYNDPSYPEDNPGSLIGEVVPQSEIDAANDGNGWIYPIFEKLTTDQFVGLDQGENRSNLFRDDYAVRLAETILLRAEAYHRKGDNQSAADDINKIRSRAQCDYLVNASDVDIDFILDERARELLAEESRWHTLLRMGGTVAVDRIRKYGLHEHSSATLTFDYNLWPIPQTVIDRNSGAVLEQNPGWEGR
ncbi:RagB/SusD family nutrient uptake outer membrane protein [Flexithrix dorotheae]|uniref:RagB/SusD family nutrient uptake outer membrane protein n=1 Tax=Flexithrix dorotheae TaxID=70993 RepID=UPI000367E605|nr:RagB/SusD family nutrient uptake outer membrane protein [Flexithrix dorotheae]